MRWCLSPEALPSLIECSTSLLITVNEAMEIWVWLMLTASSPSLVTLASAILSSLCFRQTFCYFAPVSISPCCSTCPAAPPVRQGTVLPWYLASRHLLWEVLSCAWVFLSPSASFLCPASYIYPTYFSLHYPVSLPIFLLSWTVRSLKFNSVFFFPFCFLYYLFTWAASGVPVAAWRLFYRSAQAPECVGSVVAASWLSSLTRDLVFLTCRLNLHPLHCKNKF